MQPLNEEKRKLSAPRKGEQVKQRKKVGVRVKRKKSGGKRKTCKCIYHIFSVWKRNVSMVALLIWVSV